MRMIHKIDGFWDKAPGWLLNAGWIGNGLALAAQRVMGFIKEDGYAIALFVGAWISIWGLYRKNKLQIRREELELKRTEAELLRTEAALKDDEAHRREINEIKIEREKKRGF